MESYVDFAYVYDEFMSDTPYDKWCQFVVDAIETYGISKPVRPAVSEGEQQEQTVEKLQEASSEEAALLESEKNLVLDLGCGTGTLTQMLYDKGYDMVGVDNSQEMLSIAMEKRDASGRDILYLLQDMRELELYSTIGTVISVCDSVNYILEEDELLQVFSLVDNYLYPGGLFLFDFNTIYKYSQVIGNTTIAENRENCSFIWENYYYEDEEINEYDVTVFMQQEGDLFRRFTENHYQRGYTSEQMKALVERAGMEVLCLMDADTLGKVREESERVYVLARECKKQKQ